MGDRSVDPRKARVYADCYAKEGRLRLKWFRRNEDRLVAFAEKPSARTVQPELLNKSKQDRQARYQTAERHPRIHTEDPDPPSFDSRMIKHPMKPVDSSITKLLYSGIRGDGRINYLKERCKIIPEDKYYFAETSSFGYGWNMWDPSKITKGDKRFGRCQVIKNSFYRKNNVARDPDWYQEPATTCPTVCNRS